MLAFKHHGRYFWLLLAALLCTGILPNRLLADDKDTNNPLAKPATPEMEAPAPGWTEREMWLLDRVEQLEKSLAEVASKLSSSATPVAEAPSPQSVSPNSAALSLAANTANVALGPATPVASANVIAKNNAIASMEAGVSLQSKSSEIKPAKPPKAEPFALTATHAQKRCRWTLNSSPRKSEPMSTTSTISIIPKTTPSASRVRFFAPTKST